MTVISQEGFFFVFSQDGRSILFRAFKETENMTLICNNACTERIMKLVSVSTYSIILVYKCEFESCISTFSVPISITGIEVVIKRFIAANVDAQAVLGFNIKSYVV
jgi:hypothetical protein